MASEIMFEKRSDIQPFLADSELGRFAAEIAALCKPSVCFETASPRLGGTRFGGEPDLPPAFEWPTRAPYEHGADLAARLGRRGEGFGARFTMSAPLDF